MTTPRAKRDAIDALRRRIRVIAFDANLFDRGLVTGEYPESCSKEKKRLLAAIAELEGVAPSVVQAKPKSPETYQQMELWK